MADLDFQPLQIAPKPGPGLVLRLGGEEHRYIRLTHVFDDCAYYMWVGPPELARYARRPRRIRLVDLAQLAEDPSSSWGHLSLPQLMSAPPEPESERAIALDAAWNLIAPLVNHFDAEPNLSRQLFSSAITRRAEETQTHFTNIKRLLLRYYFFGRTRLSILPLPRGPAPKENTYRSTEAESHRLTRRRGRQGQLAERLGANDFVVGEEDIEDMIASLKSLLQKGPTTLTVAHEHYLAHEFKKKHAKIYDEYVGRDRQEPVTTRQFRYYIGLRARLSDDLAKNMRTVAANAGYLGTVRAAGPGELYEIDSTGGRIHLVSRTSPPVLLRQPTIYLLVDRWSRFIVSAYVSLQPASFEEIRHALLIAFTSREKRFSALGVDVDDQRWPRGRVCAVLCPDRGTENLSVSFEQSVAHDLRIEFTPLPPLCPDGKSIVERLIRELKRRMDASGLAGTYADRPLDPHSKTQERKARVAAVHSLTEVYRVLIEFVIDHNNREHKSLRRRKMLVQAGVPPTPQEAYLWGIKNISGLRCAPFTDSEYQRLLLSTGQGSITRTAVHFKGRAFLPANDAAFELCSKAALKRRQIAVRFDKTEPFDIYVPVQNMDWPLFRSTIGGEAELSGVSLDEEEALTHQESLLWAEAAHESKRRRVVTRAGQKRKRSNESPPVTVSREQQNALRARESEDMKRSMKGKPAKRKHEVFEPEAAPGGWRAQEDAERLRNIESIRQLRRKR